MKRLHRLSSGVAAVLLGAASSAFASDALRHSARQGRRPGVACTRLAMLCAVWTMCRAKRSPCIWRARNWR